MILYADAITVSMKPAMTETRRRRENQTAWNLANGITPESIKSQIKDVLAGPYECGKRMTVDTISRQRITT
jgi:excinuclease ABC subunit B